MIIDECEGDFINNELNNSILLEKEKNIYILILYILMIHLIILLN